MRDAGWFLLGGVRVFFGCHVFSGGRRVLGDGKEKAKLCGTRVDPQGVGGALTRFCTYVMKVSLGRGDRKEETATFGGSRRGDDTRILEATGAADSVSVEAVLSLHEVHLF